MYKYSDIVNMNIEYVYNLMNIFDPIHLAIQYFLYETIQKFLLEIHKMKIIWLKILPNSSLV